MQEQPSFKILLTQAIPALRAFAFSLSRNRSLADDLVQETLMRAWEHQSSFEPGTNLRAWLFTILRNSFISEVRRRKHEVEDVDGFYSARLSQAPSQFETLEFKDFRAALDNLGADQREAVALVSMGVSYKEAAEICGVAIGTIKSRVKRARERLQELLSEDVHIPVQAAPVTQMRAIHAQQFHHPH